MTAMLQRDYIAGLFVRRSRRAMLLCENGEMHAGKFFLRSAAHAISGGVTFLKVGFSSGCQGARDHSGKTPLCNGKQRLCGANGSVSDRGSGPTRRGSGGAQMRYSLDELAAPKWIVRRRESGKYFFD
jgi:hypothetical protein